MKFLILILMVGGLVMVLAAIPQFFMTDYNATERGFILGVSGIFVAFIGIVLGVEFRLEKKCEVLDGGEVDIAQTESFTYLEVDGITKSFDEVYVYNNINDSTTLKIKKCDFKNYFDKTVDESIELERFKK